MLNSDIPCFCKQCRYRSVGFWRSQLIWICTVCHKVCEFIAAIRIKSSDWLLRQSQLQQATFSIYKNINLRKSEEIRFSISYVSSHIMSNLSFSDKVKKINKILSASKLALVALSDVHPTVIRWLRFDPDHVRQHISWKWSWNIFYSCSLHSANSRRAVVSFRGKNVHKYSLTL